MGKLTKLFSSTFWRDSFVLISGSGASQALNLIFLPVLTHIYLPSAFGWVAIFISLVEIGSLFINGGYEQAIMLPRSKLETHQMTTLSMGIALCFSFILICFSYLLKAEFFKSVGMWELAKWKYVLILSLLIQGLIQVLQMTLAKFKQYPIISISRFAKTLIQISISLLWVQKGEVFTGLLVGYFSGQCTGLVCLLVAYIRQLRKERIPLFPPFSKELIVTYSDFPIYSLLGNGLNKVSKQLPFFLLPALFIGFSEIETEIGWFSKADQLLNIQIGMMALAIGQVFYERASTLHADPHEQLGPYVWKRAKQLILLGLPITLIFLFVGPDLTAFILGSEWEQAGQYTRWLAPSYYLTFIVVPLSWLVDIKRKLNTFLYLNIGIFFMRFLTLYLAAYYYTPEMVIIAYGAVGIVLGLIQLIYLLYLGEVWSLNTDRMQGH